MLVRVQLPPQLGRMAMIRLFPVAPEVGRKARRAVHPLPLMAIVRSNRAPSTIGHVCKQLQNGLTMD